MVRNAEETARTAEADHTNTPGMCLQQCRMWADIPALFGTAAIAWQATLRKHFDRNPPRGAFVFWTGGSRGFGHIAVSLGGGNVRSTDAGGTGIVATRSIAWFDANWPSQDYVGWTDNVNGITVPGVIDTRDGFDMADLDDLRTVVGNHTTPLDTKLTTAVDKLDLLLQRTEGLRVAHGEIISALDALAVEVSDDASTELVRRTRDRILAAIAPTA